MAAQPPPEGRDIFVRKCEYNISLKGEGKYGGAAATRRARHFLLKMRVQYDNFAKQNCPEGVHGAKAP